MEPPADLVAFIRQHSSFIVVGHQDPDADCIGSQLALGSALKRLGYEVFQGNQGPFKRLEINRYQPLFSETIDPFFKTKNPAVVVLDCSTPDRLGSLQAELGSLPIAVVDHHAVGQPFGDVRWVVPKAPSTTFLVERIIHTLLGAPTEEEAYWLLLGLCTDTGFFRHLEVGSSPAFHTAARLTDAGASPKAVFQHLNGGRLLANQKLMGLVLSRVESFWDNRVLFSWEEEGDRAALGAENRESDMIYQVLQSVSGNLVVVLLRQEGPDKVTGGLRSKDVVDVASLAAAFGGGGHIRASGFSCPGRWQDVKKKILEALRPYFEPQA